MSVITPKYKRLMGSYYTQGLSIQMSITLSNFQKSYGTSIILSVEQLTLPSGIFWIKGVNGSGKSTLLKSIAGLLDFKGDITINRNLSFKKQSLAYRKVVNFAEAEPVFPEFLTGMEMIKLFATAKSSIKGQEDYYLESMQMNEYVNEPLGNYSSGMLKKLSLVLAFLGNAKVILLDEPLITLDTTALKILNFLIAEMHQKEGTTFFLSSHQLLDEHELLNLRKLTVENGTVTYSQE